MHRTTVAVLAAVATLVGYGLWAIGGITRFDVPGDPDYFVRRQAIAAALGVAGMLVAILPPGAFFGIALLLALRNRLSGRAAPAADARETPR